MIRETWSQNQVCVGTNGGEGEGELSGNNNGEKVPQIFLGMVCMCVNG